MREYAWYCVEMDCIVLQCIMNDCYIAFEWPHEVLYELVQEYGHEIDATELFTFQPLGEV